MSVLPYNIALSKSIGLWKPANCSEGWKYFGYNFYSFIMLGILFSSVFTEMIKLIESYENLESCLISATILITMVANCAKAVDVLDKHENILEIIQLLITFPCSPRNSDEKLIQHKYDRIIKFRFLAYISLVIIAVGLTVIESLFCDLPAQSLPYDAWYPMNLSIYTNYLVAWVHQNIAHIYGTLITANYDTFVSGFMLQSCAKFDILSYRLSNICCKIQKNLNQSQYNDKNQYIDEVIDCIKYHRKIIEYNKYTNDIFSSGMLLQFSVSTGVICVTVFSLSQIGTNDSHFPVLIVYLACMLVQLFLYCYTGNQVTIKSADVAKAIYCNVDWWTTSIGTQKKLFFMMLRSRKLVTYTCGKIFVLSIDSYKSVVKFSYSAYNVLQQS